MLSFNTESPLLAGTPAGTRNNSLSPRTTRHFPGIAKQSQIPMFLVCVFFFLFRFLSIVVQLPGENLKHKFLFLRLDGKIPHSSARRSSGNRPGCAASKRGLLWNLRGPWDGRVSPTAPAAHFANWLRVRAELRDPGEEGEVVGVENCAPSSARQTLMAVKWMLLPSLLLRFRLSSLGAPCVSGGLKEAASSQKAEFAAVLCIVKNLSLFLSFTRFSSTPPPHSLSR